MILFICPLALSAQDLDRKISFSVKNKDLKEVLTLISKKAGISFSYNPETIPRKKITIAVQDQSIRNILNQLLLPEDIEYRLVEDHVILRKKAPDKNQPPEFRKEATKFTISGFLRDKSTGEPLIGATVYDKDNFIGTASNPYGFYSLTLPGGSYRIMISFVGYSKKEVLLQLKENLKINFELEALQQDIREVEVLSKKERSLSDDQSFRLSAAQMTALPGFAGVQDLIRSLQVVPGIQNYGDGSTLFYVRGGNADQNLILIDDAPIFNPGHMFGFFSVLAPEAIREMEIFKGNFPAAYGGRLSSVIDIKAKNGNLKNFGCSGNIGPYASSLSLEGPVVKDKSSFFVSGRLSTINWLKFLNTTSTDFRMNFYDLNGKLNYKLNPNNRLFATFYYGNDAFNRTTESSIVTYGISWSNLAGILRWNHTFSQKIFVNTTAYYSRYAYYLYTSQEQKQYWNSTMENLALKSDLTAWLAPANTLKGGFEVAWHHSNPGNVNFKFADNEAGLKEISKYTAMEYAVYLSDTWKAGSKLEITGGLRVTLWQDLGPASVYYFDVNHRVIDTLIAGKNQTFAWYLSPEPRISLGYRFNNFSLLRFNYSRNTQFMQVLSTSTSPFTSLEVWTFSNQNVNPRFSDQVSLGYTATSQKDAYEFSAEIYSKWITNNIDYEDHANLFYNPLLEGQLRTGTARSYGIELMARKQTGRLTGWISYTYSRALLKTPEINQGKEYPAAYDRPHDLCINLAYTAGRFSFSGNWILMTGASITTPNGFYYFNGYSVPIYGERNNERLPLYHRLDLSMTYAINNSNRRYQQSISLALYNAYGRDNPFSVSFNKISSGNNFVVPSDLSGGYTLIPTTLSVAGIIPSVNYLFRF